MSPTPFPTLTPTPPPITLSAFRLSFGAIGAAFAQTVTVTEPGYTGTFALTSSGPTDCNTILTVSSFPAGNFQLTPVSVGSCLAYFVDAHGTHSPALYIQITTLQIIGQ